MRATDELRRLLDERGVEWWSMHDVENGYHQDRDTEFVIDGKKYTAHEWGNTMNVYGLIPEQAVEATLGRGECRDVYPEATYCFTCSECGHSRIFVQGWNDVTDSLQDEFNYCPNCGRKVVGK